MNYSCFQGNLFCAFLCKSSCNASIVQIYMLVLYMLVLLKVKEVYNTRIIKIFQNEVTMIFSVLIIVTHKQDKLKKYSQQKRNESQVHLDSFQYTAF